MEKILSTIILLLLFTSLYAQKLDEIYEKGRQQLDLAKFDSAQETFHDGLKKSIQCNDKAFALKFKLQIAELWIETAKFNVAENLLREIDIEIPANSEELNFASEVLHANIAIARSQIDSTSNFLSKADIFSKQISDNQLLGDQYYLKAQFWYLLSDFQRTRQAIDSAQLFYSSTNKIRFAKCYTILQKVAYRLRDRENQTLALQHIESILRELNIKEHPLWAFVYYGYGYLYFDKGLNIQFDPKCNEYFWKNYYEVKKFYAEDHPQTAIAYNYLGIPYQQQKDYDKAKYFYQKSLKVWRNVFGTDDYNASFCYTNLGSIVNHDSAIYYFNRAIKIRETVFKNRKHPLLANAYTKLASTYRQTGVFQLALYNAQKAICSVAPNFNDTINLLNNPIVGNFYDHELFKALRTKTEVISQMPKTVDSLLLYYPVEIDCLQKMDSILMNGSKSFQIVDQMLLADRNNSYSGIFLILNKLYTKTKEKKYINIAINFADKLQASLLFSQTLASDSNLTLLKKLKQDLFALEKKEIVECMVSNQYQHDKLTLKDSIHRIEIKFNQKKGPLSTKSVDITELQIKLKKDEAIIAFPTFYDHFSDSRLFAMLFISKDTVLVKFESKKSYTKLEEYINALESGSINESTMNVSNELYTILFPENIDKLLTYKKIKHLHIIPGHELLKLPFETLLTKKVNKEKQNWGQYPFLIKKYTVSYWPSINFFYRSSLKSSDRKYSNELLVVAPVFDNAECSTLAQRTRSLLDQNGLFDFYKLYRDGTIMPLPHSEREAVEICKDFKEKGYSTNLMMREIATKNNFLEKANGCRIVHLATHSFANISKPEFSGVIFSANGDNQNNILFDGEIKGLDIGADLLVLSACQTACGQPLAGEGIYNLSRSFASAKVNNVVASLWKVSDESTSLLMIDFYRHLLRSKNKSYAESLRYAKLKMLGSKKFSNPFHWAAFTLTCY